MAEQTADTHSPTAFLIVGPARCGKSSVAGALRQRLAAAHIPLDSLMAGLRVTKWQPRLGEHIGNTMGRDEWLAALRSRDAAFWEFVQPVIEDAVLQQSENVVIDGTIWPDQIVQLQCQYRAVCIVDTGDHSARLIRSRDSADTRNNWHLERGWSDQDLREWAALNAYRSEVYKEMGAERGLPVVDLADFKQMGHGLAVAHDIVLGKSELTPHVLVHR